MRKRVSEEDKKIGARIKARRIALRLTQTDLAGVIGVTFQQLQKCEHGVNRISAVNLTKLAKRMDVPVSYFLGEDVSGDSDAGMAFLGTREGARIVRALANVSDNRLKQTIADVVENIAAAANLAQHPIRIDGITEGLAFNDD